MGTSAYLIKNNLYNPCNILKDFIVVAYEINVMFIYNNNKEFLKDGCFKRLSVNIIDEHNQILEGNEKQIHFYLFGSGHKWENSNNIQGLLDNAFINKAGYIENVDDENTDLIFRFVYEYLKLNPNEYFWFEDDWVYRWEDMKKLKELPFDKDWCFKNPIKIF